MKSKFEAETDPGHDFGGSQTDELGETGNKYQEKRDSKTGKLLQRRYYGEDERASYDTDYKHQRENNHKFLHDYYWDWSNSKKPIRNLGVSR